MSRTDDRGRIRHTGDFIAGMTDRYAIAEHARFFDSPAELR
jgi:dGTPase